MNKAENKFEKYNSKYGLDRYNPLSDKDATKRLKKYGINDLYDLSGRTSSKVMFRLLYDPVSILLLVCSLILFTSRYYYPSLLVFIVWLVNNIITITLYYRAESIYRTHRSYGIPRVKVYRDSSVYLIDSRFIVPGDILIIESGDIVCADCKLLWSENLSVYEKDLTGCDEICRKYVSSDDDAVGLSDMHGRIFASSSVISGSAVAQVIRTGVSTEIVSSTGKLSMIGKDDSDLFFDVKKQCRMLGIVTTIVALLLFFVRIMVNPIRIFDVFLLIVALISSSQSEALLPISQILAARYIHKAATVNSFDKVIIKNSDAIDSLTDLSVFIVTEEIVDSESMQVIEQLKDGCVKTIICSAQKNAFNIATKYGAVICKDLDKLSISSDSLTVYIADTLAQRIELIKGLKHNGECVGVLTNTHTNVRLLGLADVAFTYGYISCRNTERYKTDINRVNVVENQIVSRLSDVICTNNVSSITFAVECAKSIYSTISDAAAYLVSAQFFRLVLACFSVILDFQLISFYDILICGMLLDLAVVLFVSYINRSKAKAEFRLGRAICHSIILLISTAVSFYLCYCIPFIDFSIKDISYGVSCILFIYALYYVIKTAVSNGYRQNISAIILFTVIVLLYFLSALFIPKFALLVGMQSISFSSYVACALSIAVYALFSFVLCKSGKSNSYVSPAGKSISIF